MLDFYLLADDQPMPDYPEDGGHKPVVSIGDQVFERLKAKKIIPERFDYYTDFRWDSALIEQIRSNMLVHTPGDSDVQPLLKMLDMARTHDSGLVAYAD